MREKYLNAASDHQNKGEIDKAIANYSMARENGAEISTIEFSIETIEQSKISDPGYKPDKRLEKFMQELDMVAVKPELKSEVHPILVNKKRIAASFSSFLNQVNTALGLSSQEKTDLRNREKEMTEFTKDVEESTPPSPKSKRSDQD